MSTEKPQLNVDNNFIHPCETLFNIEPGSTQLIDVDNEREKKHIELVDCDQYDEKDKELEQTFQDIHDAAMDAFDELQSNVESTPRANRSSIYETSALLLNTALNAAKEKAGIKQYKDKLSSKQKTPQSINNTQNIIAISPAELVKMMCEQQSPLNNDVKTVVKEKEPEQHVRKMQPKPITIDQVEDGKDEV